MPGGNDIDHHHSCYTAHDWPYCLDYPDDYECPCPCHEHDDQDVEHVLVMKDTETEDEMKGGGK